MSGNVQPDGWVVRTSVLFSPFVDQITPNSVRLCKRVRLQRRFPIDDVLLRSGDIRDQVAKLSEIVPKFLCF